MGFEKENERWSCDSTLVLARSWHPLRNMSILALFKDSGVDVFL